MVKCVIIILESVDKDVLIEKRASFSGHVVSFKLYVREYIGDYDLKRFVRDFESCDSLDKAFEKICDDYRNMGFE